MGADNRFSQVVDVRDQVRVLVVDGAPDFKDPKEGASFALQHALAPVSDTYRSSFLIQPNVVTPTQATPGLLAGHDLCILVNCAVEQAGKEREFLSPAFIDKLTSFVRDDGRGVMIFAGDKVKIDAYNRLLKELLPAQLQKTEVYEVKVKEAADGQGKEEGTDVHLDRNSAQEQAFVRVKAEDTYQALGRVNIKQIIRTLPVAELARVQARSLATSATAPKDGIAKKQGFASS